MALVFRRCHAEVIYLVFTTALPFIVTLIYIAVWDYTCSISLFIYTSNCFSTLFHPNKSENMIGCIDLWILIRLIGYHWYIELFENGNIDFVWCYCLISKTYWFGVNADYEASIHLSICFSVILTQSSSRFYLQHKLHYTKNMAVHQKIILPMIFKKHGLCWHWSHHSETMKQTKSNPWCWSW